MSCDYCNSNDEVQETIEPYIYEVYGNIKYMKLCRKCYTNRQKWAQNTWGITIRGIK